MITHRDLADIRRAADLLEECEGKYDQGFGSLLEEDGKVCAMGALAMAGGAVIDGHCLFKEGRPIFTHLCDILGMHGIGNPHSRVWKGFQLATIIAHYNDAGMTFRQIAERLRQDAEIMEANRRAEIAMALNRKAQIEVALESAGEKSLMEKLVEVSA